MAGHRRPAAGRLAVTVASRITGADIKAELRCGDSRCADVRGNNVHCPVATHADRNPSFSVRAGETASVVVHCHGGCSQEQVFAALRERGLWGAGLADVADFREPSRQVQRPAQRAEDKVQRRQVATYDYSGDDGLRYQVVRFDPKDFRQRRPDGQGGWIWNLDGVERIPYGLHELRAAPPEAIVFSLEGEKDCDAFAALGLVATTNAGGAGKWDASFGEYLAARHVVVIPDNDDVGRSHAQAVAASVAPYAASVRVLSLPGLSAKGEDASDWLTAGGTKEALLKLASDAPLWTADAQPLSGPQQIVWADFWATDQREEDWLLAPFLPRNRSIALYAPAKGGKSLFVLDIVARLATGQRVLDQPPGAPIHVGYFDMEMTTTDLYERLTDLGYGPDSDLSHLHYYLLPSLPPLDTAEGGRALLELVARDQAELVVIDTTSRVISGEENSADTMRAFYMHTGLPLKAAGITALRLDHAGKDLEKGQRGTSAKNDDVDLVWRLDPRDGGLRLHATHRRQAWIPDYLDIVRLSDPLRHELTVSTVPPGTRELVVQLDAIGVPHEYGRKRVREELAKHGIATPRNEVISAAIRMRKAVPDLAGTGVQATLGTGHGDSSAFRFGDALGDRSGQGLRRTGLLPPSIDGDSPPEPVSDEWEEAI